jgi:hypothetical protein
MKPVRLSVPLRPALTEAARVLALELLVSPKYGPRQSSFMRRRVFSRHACLRCCRVLNASILHSICSGCKSNASKHCQSHLAIEKMIRLMNCLPLIWVCCDKSLMAHCVSNAACGIGCFAYVRCISRAHLSPFPSMLRHDFGASHAWIVMYNPKSKSEKPLSRLAQPRNPVMIMS